MSRPKQTYTIAVGLKVRIRQLTHNHCHFASQQLLDDTESNASVSARNDSDAVRLFVECF